MKWLIYVGLTLGCSWLVYRLGIVGIILSAALVVLVWLLLDRIETRREYLENFAYYQSVFEPVFVVGNHPKDPKRRVFVPHCSGLVINVPHEQVHKTANEVRRWMEITGNEHYRDKTINVYERYFREGVFINESFNKGYTPRVIADFETARAKAHERLKNADGVWYREFALKQVDSGFEKRLENLKKD